MTRDFSVIIERDAEGFYVATVPGVRGCHTQARSLDELMGRVKEVIQVCVSRQKGMTRRRSISSASIRSPSPAMDLIVRTPKQVGERSALGDPFVRDIVERGIVIYDGTRD